MRAVDDLRAAAALLPCDRSLVLTYCRGVASGTHSGVVFVNRSALEALVTMAGAYHAVMSADEESREDAGT